LTRFTLADWAGEVMEGGSGALVGVSSSGTSTSVAMSATVVHRRADRSGIDVTAHRGDDEDHRNPVGINMLMRTERDRLRSLGERAADAEHRRLHEAVTDGSMPWTSASFDVDGEAVHFEVLENGGQWVAVGEVRDVIVTLDSYGVDRADVRLVTYAESSAS
jgi:hypothetical protein